MSNPKSKYVLDYSDHPDNICPECGEKCITSFRCSYYTRFCINGHPWYFIKGEKIKGNPDSFGTPEEFHEKWVAPFLAKIKAEQEAKLRDDIGDDYDLVTRQSRTPDTY